MNELKDELLHIVNWKMSFMGKKFDDILKKLLRANLEIKAAAIISAEGLPIASVLPQSVDETKFSAMTATLLSLSERAIIEMRTGNFNQLYIKGSEGYLLVMQAGLNAVLTISTTNDVRLGLILLDCKKVCENIAKLFLNDDGDKED